MSGAKFSIFKSQNLYTFRDLSFTDSFEAFSSKASLEFNVLVLDYMMYSNGKFNLWIFAYGARGHLDVGAYNEIKSLRSH